MSHRHRLGTSFGLQLEDRIAPVIVGVKYILLLVCFSLSAAACRPTSGRKPYPPLNGPGTAWLTSPPAGLDGRDHEHVPPSSVYDVTDGFIPELVLILEQSPIVRVTPEEFQKYTGKVVPAGVTGSPYLVRCVGYKGEATGDRVIIDRIDRTLQVRCPNTGDQLIKRPAVVFMTKPATIIILYCSTPD